MRVFLTGATGFIGGEVARRLVARGDTVVALVRDPARAPAGVEVVQGDLADAEAIRRGLAGADAAIHAAAVYELGVSGAAARAMEETNVGGTERVLGAAVELGIPRIVHVSTVAVFGNTGGRVVDETQEPIGEPLAQYDRTKREAHAIAKRLGATIVQPGGVYGPGDSSQLGGMMSRFVAGRLPALTFPALGLNAVHRDDVADGILLALERGRPGEAYVLGGELTTLRDLFATLARVVGRRPPRLVVPDALLRPLGRLNPKLRDLIRASDGVTYWAKDDRARRELGYAPRGLEQGLRDTFGRPG